MKHILGTNCETWFRVMPGFVVVFWQMSKKKSQKKRCLLECTLVYGVVAYRLEGHLSYFVYIMNTVLIPLYNLADCDAWFVFVQRPILPFPLQPENVSTHVSFQYTTWKGSMAIATPISLGLIMAPLLFATELGSGDRHRSFHHSYPVIWKILGLQIAPQFVGK